MARPDILQQDQVWLRGERLDEMDRHHRANLIPFLRGNVTWLYASRHDGTPATKAQAEEWLEQTPLMLRLCALEAGRPIEDRRTTHERNQAHEAATGYQKVRLG